MATNFRERLNNYLRPIEPLQCAIWALYVTIWDAIRSRGPKAIAGAAKWREEAFVLWFRTLSPHFSRFERTTVVPELVASAEGIILELGPGLGNQIPLFDQTKIGHIYGVEINGSFIPDLQAKAGECGLREKYTAIHAGVGDTDVLEKHGIKPGSIDTILSIQVFCSVAQPEAVAREMYRLLKPGGKLIFWEHRRSHDWVTRIVQNFWNISWSYLVGCNLNRDITRIIKSAGAWEDIEAMKIDENPSGMLPRVYGVLVKS
ncbi:S-adenosyl-L-methionine-dependent methyltransferase [Hypoxylon cercidicola]|nr:S-adenosyl-L-methionine-dependent methyltransferase [Hypoxylon cercidicola]